MSIILISLVVLTRQNYEENIDWGIQKVIVGRNNGVVGLTGLTRL